MPDELVKRATDPAGRARLRREAAILLRARHPGVVGPATVTEDERATALHLPRLDAPDLAEQPPADAVVARRFGAALARTVADLHHAGIAHRDLHAAHVLVDDARPVLCGFAEATDRATDADRALDDAALVDLVELLSASVATGGTHAQRRAAASLRRVAAAARASTPPWPAARLAEELAGPRAGAVGLREASRRVAAFAAVPVVVALGVVVFARSAGDRGTSAGASTDAGGAASTTRPSTTGSGAPVVDAGGARFAAGEPGDVLAVGDWACTGEPSALLLRPATGELWLFRTLPAGDEVATAELVGRVPGAGDLARDALASGPCAVPAVIDAQGRRVDVGPR